jgi:signal transduction histidine kinase
VLRVSPGRAGARSTIAAVTETPLLGARDDERRALTATPSPEWWEGVFLFEPDGRLVAATPGVADLAGGPLDHVAELEARYRQSDGMPIDLRRRGRHVGIPIGGQGTRVVLVSEPLEGTDGRSQGGITVAILAFRDESDPHTVQRALGSVLAHELRTPLTTVFGGADLLLRRALPEKTRSEAARSVANAAEQLHRVIEDLVILVRWSGERGDETEPVLLPPIVRAAIGEPPGPPAPVDVHIDPDLAPIVAVPAVVEHILRNLLARAAANSPPGGRVRVEARTDGGWVEVRVADDGPSLTEDERVRAFDLFASSARQAGDPSGANLAMVAARRLTERLGGEIRAGSPARGAEAIVRLPAAAE